MQLGDAGDAAGDTTGSTSATARRCGRARWCVASGARYRRLDVANLAQFEGSCVHYWASPIEARLCAGQEVALVGAGNSAGQAAVYLASQVKKVWLLVRGAQPRRQHVALSGRAHRGAAEHRGADRHRDHGAGGRRRQSRSRALAQPRSGEETARPIRHLFLFIGADPNTDWLAQCGVALDDKGFVRTGADGGGRHPLETNRRGVFAIGDVRSGSVKRVAAAVGEGAQVVAALHAYLAQAGARRAPALHAESCDGRRMQACASRSAT